MYRQPKDIVLEARAANLKMKEKLTDLSIDFRDSTEEDEMVLEGLEPHSNLRYLKIWGYGGVRLPSWMMDDNLHCRLPNLVQIKILNCKSCTHLCSLGRLPHLKDMFLEVLDNVEYIEKNTSSNNADNSVSIMHEPYSVPLFPSLERLRLKGMSKLKGWWMMSPSGDQDQNHPVEWKPAFPKLKVLTADAIRLATIIAWPPKGFASLEHLYISEKLKVSQPLCQTQTLIPLNSCFPNLRCLHLSGDQELEVFPEEFRDLFSLKFLRISNCKQLKSIPEWIDSLTSLTSLCIWECPKLDSLPRQIINLSKLKLLGISGCSRVLSEKCQCRNPTGEYWPYIQHIPCIKIRHFNSMDDVSYQV